MSSSVKLELYWNGCLTHQGAVISQISIDMDSADNHKTWGDLNTYRTIGHASAGEQRCKAFRHGRSL